MVGIRHPLHTIDAQDPLPRHMYTDVHGESVTSLFVCTQQVKKEPFFYSLPPLLFGLEAWNVWGDICTGIFLHHV
jgi:hypothetical protein